MPTEHQITEDDILSMATEKSFERGVDYYDSGLVESVTKRGNRLFAEVQGSEWEPYSVGVTLQEDDFTASCTCPYDWGGYCKHIVAALLTFVHDRDRVKVSAPIEDLLSKLNADELRALVKNMIEADPKLTEVLDCFCAQAVPTNDASSAQVNY